MLGKLGILRAIRAGIMITLKNFFQLFLVMSGIAAIRFIANALLLKFLTPAAIKTDVVISSLLIPSNRGNQILESIPSLGLASFIITMFVVPWTIVFFTLEYIKSAQEINSPAFIAEKQPTE